MDTPLSQATVASSIRAKEVGISRLREVDRTKVDQAKIAIVHDYLTVIGGAERVVLSMIHTFPKAPIYTSLYEPKTIIPELASGHDIRASVLNRVGLFRRNHRTAMPILGPTFSRIKIDADVVLCSSSGWAHGVQTSGRKLVYCHNPARWLYQRTEYLQQGNRLWWLMATGMHPYLRRWDRAAAASCDRYVANSSIVAERIRNAYSIDAEVLPPPTSFESTGPLRAVSGLEAGFFLSPGRLMGHKNTAALVEAFAAHLPDLQLVIVGVGPEGERLAAGAPPNVHFTGQVDDDELRWLYANCTALISASREDFGLTPLEAACFGKPSVLLRYGGFLDTMVDGETAVFFDQPEPAAIAIAVIRARTESWDQAAIRENAQRFSTPRFQERLRAIVAEELREQG
ncbi:MAG: glycosyl transferase family 1 [Actinomycetia bacterium]|nr:glycosyl transferase family 1 [Actinomycetes bacterium]